MLFPGSWRASRGFETVFLELPERRRSPVGSLQVTAHPVVHPSGAPSYALRVEMGGKALAYSGDTEWTEQLLDASDGAGLFICECSFYDRRVRYHLDLETLTAHRSEFACERIVLTHMSPEMLSRADGVGFECAFDGMEIRL